MKTYNSEDLRELLIKEIRGVNEYLLKQLFEDATGDKLIENGANCYCIESELSKEELSDLTRFEFLD